MKQKRKADEELFERTAKKRKATPPDWLALPLELWFLVVMLFKRHDKDDLNAIFSLRLTCRFFRLRVLAPGLCGFVQKIKLYRVPKYYRTLYRFGWLDNKTIPGYEDGYNVQNMFHGHRYGNEAVELQTDMEKYKVHSVSFYNRNCILKSEIKMLPASVEQIVFPRCERVENSILTDPTPSIHGSVIAPLIYLFKKKSNQIKHVIISRRVIPYFESIFNYISFDTVFTIDNKDYSALICATRFVINSDLTHLITLAKQNNINLNENDQFGLSPSRAILTYGKSDCFDFLIEAGLDPIYQIKKGTGEESFLCQAIRERNTVFLDCLMRQKYNIFPDQYAQLVQDEIFITIRKYFFEFSRMSFKFLVKNSSFFRFDPKKLFYLLLEDHILKIIDPYFAMDQRFFQLIKAIPNFSENDLFDYLYEKNFSINVIYGLLWLFRSQESDRISYYIKLAFRLANLNDLPTELDYASNYKSNYRYSKLFYRAFNLLCYSAIQDEKVLYSPVLSTSLYLIISFWDPNVNIADTSAILYPIAAAVNAKNHLITRIHLALAQHENVVKQFESMFYYSEVS